MVGVMVEVMVDLTVVVVVVVLMMVSVWWQGKVSEVARSGRAGASA